MACELCAGQEIYLRRPDAYRLVGCTASFEQVAELAREQERPETAIGYITQARPAPDCMAACSAVHLYFSCLWGLSIAPTCMAASIRHASGLRLHCQQHKEGGILGFMQVSVRIWVRF